ncbi:ATP-dependent helicase [Spongisporangium articulatum]|uniref:DNA 3'-5' helicase n=1 Tax=Spongisporangium articulatum TaxID=3362603 RepID=A0ABW8APX5_9ACTN
MPSSVRLLPPPPVAGDRLELDDDQRLVVDRRQGSGPVVLLGAPGTGKTTTLVEAAAARVVRDGVQPGSVLALAPTRQAAARLRDLLSARIGGTVREPVARTPHSYAFGVLRRARVLAGEPPPQLISGPEQDRMLAELLAGHADGAVPGPRWPDPVDEHVLTLRGFRGELRDLMMRAVERGITPEGLADLGRRFGRPDWPAAAQVLAEYLDVTALATPGAYDPAGIVDEAAALLAADRELLHAELAERQLIVVDDAQELTAATVRLLRLLAGGGRDLLLAGDPDAATQGFRGASPRFLGDAPELFSVDGEPAPVVGLGSGTGHRQGPVLRAVARRVAERIASAGAVRHRAAAPDPEVCDERCAVRILASPAREAAYIAQYLRRAHLERGVGWARMAVIARSTKDTAPVRRALAAAGVPVALPPTEVPVRDEPAVVPLRHTLRAVLHPATLDPDTAAELLAGPFGGADAIAMRRLRQALRARELARGGERGSDPLLVESILATAADADSLDDDPMLDPVLAPVRRVAAVLAAGQAALGPGASAETVLWALWSATGLAEPWQRLALSGGVAGRRADRDLDAVMALFEAASRFVDRFPKAGPAPFLEYLEGQEVPADTLADRAPAGQAVALLTAQAAAGLEWDVVVVTGVHEGAWPDLRLRGSLLGAQRLVDVSDGRGGPSTPGAEDFVAQRRAVLDDELRLFHVAVSRARRELLVTAVRSDDLMPSPFVDLVDPDGADDDLRPLADVPDGLTLPALVARLRAVVVDDDASDRRRGAAARQLARLAAAGVPGADPQDWWGLAPLTVDAPLRGPGEQVSISPSQVEQYQRCALRWLLEQSGGRRPSSSAQELGNLVHELAEEVPDGDRATLLALLEERFDRLGLGSGWVADAEKARARQMVEKLAQYVAKSKAAGRELVATERAVQVDVGRARINGLVDRLERDPEGLLVVVDLKTGKSAPTKAEVARHAQLGVYQLAVEEGGFELLPGEADSGGAALVQLGGSQKSVSVQEQPPLTRDPDPGWARDLVLEVADGMAGSQFAARNNSMCRVCSLRRACPVQTEGRQVTE